MPDAATSLASSAGGIAATALSSFGGSLTSVRNTGLSVVTGRSQRSAMGPVGENGVHNEDEDEQDPRWFRLEGEGEDDAGGRTPSGASWDDATSLPEDELQDFLAGAARRRASAGGSSRSPPDLSQSQDGDGQQPTARSEAEHPVI
ncbi:hypothetical protein OIO90_001074 [Microbotryomycetes sp. JL221]|nr:hypothetical protein OIO90_001074 [Microbotryomycetes sp. JL221]